MKKLEPLALLLGSISLALVGCGAPTGELVDDTNVVFANMLTGEACDPDPETFQSADHGGEGAQSRFNGGENDGECQGECTGDGEPQGDGECQGGCTGEPQGDGECQGECTGEPQGDGEGECTGEPQGPHGEQGECQGDCSGEQTHQRTRTREGLQCGEGYYHAEDFPQPGCDGEGCCQVSAEDAEQVQQQERVRCRCRARFQGDMDESSLPECCADRPERECIEDDEPASEDEPAEDEDEPTDEEDPV